MIYFFKKDDYLNPAFLEKEPAHLRNKRNNIAKNTDLNLVRTTKIY